MAHLRRCPPATWGGVRVLDIRCEIPRNPRKMGLDNRAPAMHVSDLHGKLMVFRRKVREESRATISGQICRYCVFYGVCLCGLRPYRGRESCRRDEHRIPCARLHSSPVLFRRRCQEKNVFVVERIAAAEADKIYRTDHRQDRTRNGLAVARIHMEPSTEGTGAGTEQDLPRDREGDGGAMVSIFRNEVTIWEITLSGTQ